MTDTLWDFLYKQRPMILTMNDPKVRSTESILIKSEAFSKSPTVLGDGNVNAGVGVNVADSADDIVEIRYRRAKVVASWSMCDIGCGRPRTKKE
jgi:hypothetical protein